MAIKRIGSITVSYEPTAGQTQMYNMLGRQAGLTAAEGNQSNPNFFQKKWNSLENTFGTTGAAIASKIYDDKENLDTEQMLNRHKTSLDDIAKKYGYNTLNDFYNKYGEAEDNNDLTFKTNADNSGIWEELKAQTATNANEADNKAKAYEDYRKNNYVSQKINQDPGKFAGSAMNTLSTMADVGMMTAGIPAGVVANSAQGAWEGVADELEQNGFQNFSGERAAKNAIIGAATGAATGALNSKINANLATKNGNLFKGGNVVTSAINKFNSTTKPGRVLSTIGSGIARGAQSGLVGGAVGSGLSSVANGDFENILGNTLQGAAQGTVQGATTGGIMAGTNMVANAALNKYAPGIAERVRNNQMQNASYGEGLKNQFKGAWDSGDSAVAENILKPVVNNVDNFVDSTRTRIVNRNAIGRLTSALDKAMDGGTKGNTKFVRLGNDLLDDLNNIRVENGLDPLTNRQVTAYENAINNNLINRVKEGMSTSDVALMAFNALTSDNSKAVPGYYNNQLVVSEPGMVNDYDGTVLGLAEDGGTSLKSIEPRNKSQIEMFEENGQQKMGPRSQLGSSPVEEQPVNNSIVPQNRENVNSWDRIAHEGGYASYDDAIKSFMAANPNAEVNAGAVLTWMDNNPGDWNPNQRTTVEAPGNEVYRAMNTEGEQEGVKLPEVLTGKQIKGKRQIVEEVIDQFNRPNTPTVRSTKPSETFYNLYEDWGLSDGDDIRQAVSYAEQGSLIPQMIREAAGQTGIIDLSDAQGMVLELGLKKGSNYNKTVAALSDIWDSMPNEDIVGGKSGVDALRFQRAVEQAASDAKGTNGTYRIGNGIIDQTTAENLSRIANNIGDHLDEAAVANNAVQNVVNKYSNEIQEMRNAFPNNQKWQNQIDTKIANAKTIRDLRSSIRDLTRANIYIKNGDDNFATVGGKMAARQNDVPTSKAQIRNKAVNWVWDKINDSKVARNARLARNEALVKGDTKTATANVTPAVTNATTTSGYNPMTQVYNAIGRNTGLDNGETRSTEYVAEAAQTTPLAPNAGAANLEELVTNPNTGTTSVYDAVYGSSSNPTSYSGSYSSGDDTLTMQMAILQKAMTLALNDGDLTAYSELAQAYKNAASLASDSGSGSTANLSSTQQAQLAKLDAADSAIDELETLFNKAGGGKKKVAGTLQSIAGDWGLDADAKTYNDMAEGLVNQIAAAIGKTDSLNTEGEVKRALKLIPQLTDDATTAQNKLEELRRMLQTTKSSYYSAYGL